ncbi:hypothetical protein THMIRHAS_12160 [Thiosulfatimonas sediminis]|uniref:DUF3087 domain-containing protein n=1 Tax=Thiosulfatimonas sediminis TaxID=2675054 RepID=A0A6F8PUM8_9GAMM|nr:DUF3087 family protein [Thiosulfatimonas sediminis]BBP45843.1 hypothetical protein THMIRHAS_12160 [Thiosulfatimonas sediminis]
MFTIEPIDAIIYRRKSRNATLVMLAIFIVIGFLFASLSVHYLSEYNSNKLVLNFLGAFVGLLITAVIVKKFMADKPIMAEAMYGFRLKRNLMHVTNRLRHIQEAVQKDDPQAMKILRFYHLGLTQMHQFEQNSSALLDMEVEKRQLEQKMTHLGLELEQLSFDPEWVKHYQEDRQDD